MYNVLIVLFINRYNFRNIYMIFVSKVLEIYTI